MKTLHFKRRNMVINFEDGKKYALIVRYTHTHTHEFSMFRTPAT